LISLFVIAGLILTFGHIAEEVIEGDSAKFDQTVVLLFRHANDLSNAIGPPWMEEMARDITALGSYAVLIIITGAVLLYLLLAHRRSAALWVSLAFLGGVLLSNLLKLAYERPRPDFVTHAARVFTSSFPSGHATLSAITYLTLGALLAGLHESFWFKVYFLGLAICAHDRDRHQSNLSWRSLSNGRTRRLVYWCRLGRALLECLHLAPASGSRRT